MTAVYNAATKKQQRRSCWPDSWPSSASSPTLHAADQWAVEPAIVDDVLDAQRWARERAQRAVSGMAL